MNRLNQTEPATFSILPYWDFLRDSYNEIDRDVEIRIVFQAQNIAVQL
jgi:hypothetical protein